MIWMNRSEIVKLCVVLTVGMMLVFTVGSTIVQAEGIEEHGRLSTEMEVEFDDLTYVVGDDVVYSTDFSDEGHWILTEDYDVSDDFVSAIEGRRLVFPDEAPNESPTATLNEEDVPALSSSTRRYYETRVFVESSSTELELSVIGDNGFTITLDVDSGDFLVNGEGKTGLNVDGYIWYRIGFLIDNEGSRVVKLFNDGYDIIATDSSSNSMSSSAVEGIEIDSYLGSEWVYFFASDGTGEMDEIKYPDFDDVSWRPESKSDERLHIDYQDTQNYFGDSSEEFTRDVFGVDESELSHTEHVSEFSHEEAVEFIGQTSEDTDESFTDRRGYWQGWNGLRDYIERQIINMIQEEHMVDWTQVSIIRYDVDDIHIINEYDEDVVEEIHEAYAEQLLNVGMENDWLIRSNTTGGEWSEIDSVSRFRDDVMEGWYEINTVQELGDVTEYFQVIADGVKQDSFTQFAVYSHSTADLSNAYGTSIDGVYGDYGDMSYGFQGSNLVLSHLMSEDGLDAIDSDDNTFSVSLNTLQDNVFNETLFFEEDDGIRTGLPAHRPLTIGTYEPTTEYITLLLVGVLAVVVLASAIFWGLGYNDSDSKGRNAQDRD